MSSGRKISRELALDFAERAEKILEPKLEKIQLAGSLRRGRDQVGDIEFVAAPIMRSDLFSERGAPVLQPVREALLTFGTWVKGREKMMQVTDVFDVGFLKLELYLVTPPAQWGSILAIRTGPKDLGALCMKRLRERGLVHSKGRIIHSVSGKVVPTPREEDFFVAAEVPFEPPQERDDLLRWAEAGGLGSPSWFDPDSWPFDLEAP